MAHKLKNSGEGLQAWFDLDAPRMASGLHSSFPGDRILPFPGIIPCDLTHPTAKGMRAVCVAPLGPEHKRKSGVRPQLRTWMGPGLELMTLPSPMQWEKAVL